MRSTFMLVLVAAVACRSAPTTGQSSGRYIATATPIDVGGVSTKLCIAIDPADPEGVWWWHPGRGGCSSRSTGPGVFRGERAKVVARGGSRSIEASFQLQLIVRPESGKPPIVDVLLVLQDESLQSLTSGARVPTEGRVDLIIPEWL